MRSEAPSYFQVSQDRVKRTECCKSGRSGWTEPAGFLDRQGPGLHHVAYQVTDIDATLEALRNAGMELIDQQPRTGIRGSRVAFMHPRATAGVLTEIVEPAAGAEDR